jgi:hypothetical protein
MLTMSFFRYIRCHRRAPNLPHDDYLANQAPQHSIAIPHGLYVLCLASHRSYNRSRRYDISSQSVVAPLGSRVAYHYPIGVLTMDYDPTLRSISTVSDGTW